MPLKLVRRARSPYWIIRGSVAGVRIEETTGTADFTRADQIRVKREGEVHREAVYGRPATATFAEAALSYLEAGGSERHLKPVADHFGLTPLAQIDQDAIDQGARKVYPGAGPATRNRQFYTPVSAVLTHAARRGWCSRPLLERPRQPEGRIRWLMPEEAERLIGTGAEHLKPLLIFLFYTGARLGEALWLDWHAVDLARGHVSFLRTKSRRARGVPLHAHVVAALANLEGREGEVFRRPDGLPYERLRSVDDHSAGSRIATGFRAACRRAGIVDFHPHDCRHTWATWHYAANRDIGALMRLGGWTSERMVMRYAHVNVDELAATIARLPGGLVGDNHDMEARKA